MPRKIIIDTDPGIDDTMLIMGALHSPELEILGLTTVFGNAEVDVCAQNGLRLVELEGHQHIPVTQGCAKALFIPTAEVGTYVHGLDGMGNTNPPAPKSKLDPRHAAQFIVDTVRANPGEVTLVPVGPLSNLGLALQLEPALPSLVKEVVLMGGAAYAPGNISPVAEANIAHDPHAAALVYGAGWKITMLGLDVTTQTTMTPDYLAAMFKHDTPAVRLIQQILPCYQAFHHQFYGMNGAIHTHDPSCLAYLLAPELYKTQSLPMFVETTGLCAGQTIPDPHKQWGNLAEVNVCLEVNSQAVLDLLFERITRQ
jgi:purine nucleosidase